MSVGRIVKILIAMGLLACSIIFGLIHGCSVDKHYSTYAANTYYTDVNRRTTISFSDIGQDVKVDFVKSAENTSDIIFTTDSNYVPPTRDNVNWISKVIGRSPIIALCADTSIRQALTEVKASNSHVAYMIDMPALVREVIDNSDETGRVNLSTIGVDVDKSVQLVIPTTGSRYRREVVNALVYCITNGEPVTSDNREEVKSRLNILLSKVVSASDIEEYLRSSKHIVILPEYFVLDEYTTEATDTSLDVTCRTFIYWEETSAVDLWLWVNDNAVYKTYAEIEGVESNKSINNESKIVNSGYIYDSLESSDMFYNNTHFRNSKLNKINTTVYTIDNYKFNTVQSDLEDLLGVKYWGN